MSQQLSGTSLNIFELTVPNLYWDQWGAIEDQSQPGEIFIANIHLHMFNNVQQVSSPVGENNSKACFFGTFIGMY